MDRQPIPPTVGDAEPLIRIVFSPYHVEMKEGQVSKIKKEAFYPPKSSNEISVIRLGYTTLAFCQARGRAMSRPGGSFVGFAQTMTVQVRQQPNTEVVASPLDAQDFPLPNFAEIFTDTPGTPSHADIVYDFRPTHEEPLPQQFKLAAKAIASSAIFLA
jgi:hypothetical protein